MILTHLINDSTNGASPKHESYSPNYTFLLFNKENSAGINTLK